MDAFRLLTRSTKLKSISGRQSTATPLQGGRLPSAGKAENPQLFRGSSAAEEQQQSKKRKREEDGDANENSDAEDDVNLDFFSSAKGLLSGNAKDSKKRPRKEHADGQSVSDSDSEGEDAQVMDESQRRSILKTHKIKVTDLRDLEEILPVAKSEDATKEKEKKKKKKEKKEKKEKSAVPALTKKQQKELRRLYPEPLVSFQQLRKKYRISRRLAENIAEQGFSVPTEVQMGSLPLLLGHSPYSGETRPAETPEPDLAVVAPTGSGKTLAFMIPLITKIVRHHHEHPGKREIFAVIVAPTKELVWQIVNEGRKLALGTGVKITGMKKGMQVLERTDDDDEPLEEEREEDNRESSESEDESDDDADANANGTTRSEKKKKPRRKSTITKSDILVTTPLLLVNALSANQTKSVAPMPSIRNLVLDEADVLLDPLFREQTTSIWSACTNPQLRVSMWSATMGSSIEQLIKSIIQDRRTSLGLTDKTPLIRVVIGLKDTAVPNITHKLIYAATEHGKLLGLRQLIHPTATIAPPETRLRPPFLIFTQTIPRAVALHSELLYDIPPEAGGSSRIAVLHSEMSETRRSEIMKGFRKGEIWVIVTTDLLARGVDFRGINGVVNYDIPTSAAAYVHRVGRTGRAGREGGIAVTFYTKEDIPYVKPIANMIDMSEKLQGKPDSERSVQKWLLDALPDLSKKDKKELKRHGVKARQASAKLVDAKERAKTRISTKSGFDRRRENKRKAAIASSRQKKLRAMEGSNNNDNNSGDEEWEGFDE
ncbi:hypothetical protein VTN96DRAFT_7702 [Rasamsonia emersonii]|uniref:ATP-dependent RNA helicase ROK1 n=1 Tax=Rasamsonia emersonii (strain ATCC 16479 / CBS 393.64 / IMI 116815) TaxID=1408163 RepID=A0A0F4YY89_RASE3|nr:RNA helicase [Rasamsonia emersonii CBS 393.64]KKA23252.1 RNA helicase [Rasamsonia emersonii CBS 393.64]